LRRRLVRANLLAHDRFQLRPSAEIPVNLFDAKFLIASLLWGSIGGGYFIYGKKQQEIVPLIGGLAMIAVSYLVGSALLMSLISIALMVAVYVLLRRG
jgi:hypothetical protein